ncbi:MAG TPA: ThuA domain-containing protein, partial [Chthoniobacteraceae bacterium]
LLRFRNWPAEQMKHFISYFESGKPIIALRTSTHAFDIQDKSSPFAKFHWKSTEGWIGGFGQHVLGETWVSHHGVHKKEATRGVIEASAKDHPVLRGVQDIFGTTDVYEVKNLPKDAKVLVRGQVLAGMNPTDAPLPGAKNDPMMPIVWTREYKHESGKTNKILTTTMGSGTDFENEGLRRLVVNGAYWTTGLEDKIPAQANVSIVGEYKPSFYGFDGFIKGVKPSAHELKQ